MIDALNTDLIIFDDSQSFCLKGRTALVGFPSMTISILGEHSSMFESK